MIQYSLQPAHHPDWAWQTPEGFRDEPFVLNFVFLDLAADGRTIHQALPVQVDDDAEFHVRSFLCPQLGMVPRGVTTGNSGGVSSPGRVRITTSNGQQLSRELMLYSGLWCGAGMAALNACGGSLVDPLVVPAGGALTLDLLLATNSEPATVSQEVGDSILLVYANIFGTGGNGRTLTLADPGAPNSPLSGSTLGNNGTVSLATDGAGLLISTLAEVMDFINTDPDLSALFAAILTGDGSELAAADVLVFAGGAASEPVDVAGAFVGVKRYRAC